MYQQEDFAAESGHCMGRCLSPYVLKVPWGASIKTSSYGPISIAGLLTPMAEATEVVIMVYERRGSTTSYNLPAAIGAFHDRGIVVLRLSQRGASRDGADLHHAGLWEGLAHVVLDPLVKGYEGIDRVGFSMGGHIALHLARQRDSQLRPVVAICSPLFLDTVVKPTDQWSMAVDRRCLLAGRKSLYRVVAVHRSLPTSPHFVDRTGTLRTWPGLAIGPRFGVCDVNSYDDRQSIRFRRDEIETRSLRRDSRHDPLVPPQTIHNSGGFINGDPRSNARFLWFDGGGHVAFPDHLNLGFETESRPYPQGIEWLRAG